MTKEELKTEWVKALRSGEYKQGCTRLKTPNGEYCCLGVLCDVYRKMTGDGEWDDRHYFGKVEMSGGGITRLPARIASLIGLPSFIEDELMNMNDSGFSFEQIALRIETNL